MRKFLILIALSPCLLLGQTRKYSNAFLDIGVDARSMAMSKSVVASSNNVNAGYWNPAGLTSVRDSWQASAMHAEYFASIAQYDYAGFAAPIDEQSSFGVSFVRFGVDDILNTTELIDQDGNVDYDRISKFSAADYALLLSYARKINSVEGLSLGGSFKTVYRQIGEFANAIGFGFDVGVQYKSASNWQWGAILRDATTTYNTWSINESSFEGDFEANGNDIPEDGIELTPPTLRLGVGKRFNFNSTYSLQAETNLDLSFGGRENTLISSHALNLNPNIGVEFGYKDFIFLRTGVGNINRSVDFDNEESYRLEPNIGIGFRYRGIGIDYALTNIASASGSLYSNLFSLNFNFGDFKSS